MANKSIKKEVIAISILFIIILLSFLILKNNNTNHRQIVIYSGNEIITKTIEGPIDFENDGIYTIRNPYGGYNKIEIKNRKIRVIDADCPDKICVAHGFLNEDIDNDMIICAPYGLAIIYN